MSVADAYEHWRWEVSRRWCLLSPEPYSTAALAKLLYERCGLSLAESGKLRPDEVLAKLDELLNEAPPRQLVDMVQAAAMVHRSKRTLEECKKRMPPPAVAAVKRSGKPSLWDWTELRPWLETEYDVKLPSRYPTLEDR